jgi:uncharacterized Fe-S radical SAM superfamily protein PflX
VYNCGGYESLEVIKLLDGIVDIYLPDFKYTDGKMSEKYSSGAADYPEAAAAAIEEMHRQVGELVVDERGIALRGSSSATWCCRRIRRNRQVRRLGSLETDPLDVCEHHGAVPAGA